MVEKGVVMGSRLREKLRVFIFLPLIILLVVAGAAPALAVTVNPGGGDYATLKGAFDAINAGLHTGTIAIDITGDTTETATAVLNASGSGAASYASISIQPSGGVARTISGAMPAGSPLIDFNGADNVTINGLNTGGNSLTISNTTVSATAGTSTVRFQADATNNTITNCSILGSSTMATTSDGGNIWFGAASTVSGNSSNTISNNSIGPAGSNLPTKLIYSSGSTTSDAVFNTNNLISNNNLFDYFNPAAQSNAVYLYSGSAAWTINNNRIYQSATRTQTAGYYLVGIQAASATGNYGHTITSNVIGFAAADGTGRTSFTGAGSNSYFLAILLSAASTTSPTSIQGNRIAGIDISGTGGGFGGIYILAGQVNIGDVSGNTIGSLTDPASITRSTNTTFAMNMWGILYGGSSAVTIANNIVAGITATNSGSAAFTFFGMYAYTNSAVTNTIQNNTIGSANAPIAVSATQLGTRLIGIDSQTGAAIVTGNSISNLTIDGPNTGPGSNASLIGLWIDNSAAGSNVTQNSISRLTNSNSSAAVWVTGLHYTGQTSGTNLVQRNLIHSIEATGSSPAATVNGIYIQAGNTGYHNNMIALGTSLTVYSPQIHGIYETGGSNNIHHNSIYIGGTNIASGSGNSFALRSPVTSGSRNYRNNIFSNARSNLAATGKHYAFSVSGTAPNPAGLTSNNNLLYAPGTGGLAGLFNSVDLASLASWQTTTGVDSNSASSDPRFLNPSGNPPDLHLNALLGTVAEGNGVDMGIADDFDGQTRSTLTPVDIGADAGDFTVSPDLIPPSIAYIPLSSTSLTGDRTLTVTMADRTGVATGPLAPRIYYKKNAGSYVSSACSQVGGTVQNGSWNCDIAASNLGGVAQSDVIRYFVVAQDTLGNFTASPLAGVLGVDVNSVTIPPTTPNQYTILTPLSGSYNVGPGQTHTSLTNAGGIFEALNAGALTGSVIINITGDLTGETGSVALNQLLEENGDGYTLLIRPAGGARIISGASSTALIRLNDADRVSIDGSTSGATAAGIGGDPLLRELTINNTSTATSASVIAVSGVVNGAQNNTLRNLNILGQDPLTTSIGISLGGATAGTAGVDNDNNRIENCSVRKAVTGIYSAGQNAVNPNTGTVIIRNDLSATGTGRISRVGIVLFNDSGALISENHVGGLDSNTGSDVTGIAVGTLNILYTNTTAGGVTNALVSRNRISGIINSSLSSSAAGIAVAGDAGGAITCANNMITGVIANSTYGRLSTGFFVAGAPGSTTRILFNSIAMTGSRVAMPGQYPSYGIAVTGSDPVVELKDNIFYTTQDPGTGSAKNYAIGMATTTFANLDSDYNDYFSGGPLPGYFRSGSLAPAAGTDYATLDAWRSAVGKDANSKNYDPSYIDPTSNVHLNPSSPLFRQGTSIAGITLDYDGQLRRSPPDIGADDLTAFLITGTAGSHGSMSPAGSVTVPAGIPTSFTITPDTGYHIDTVTGSCGGTLSGSTYTTAAITADCTVSASFAINSYTLTYTAGANGSITGSSPQTVNHGGSGTQVTALPNTGYHFVTWSDTSTANPRTDTNVATNINVTASFAINTYTVTPSADSGGSISPNTPQSVTFNTTRIFTIKPLAGYRVATPVRGTCGGSYTGSVTDTVNGITYTTNAVTTDCNVLATFTPLACSRTLGWWQGENNANDSSGNGLNGSSVTTGSGTVSYAAGKAGSAISLANAACTYPNGSNCAHIIIPDSSTALDLGNTPPFTIAAWVNIAGAFSGGYDNYGAIFDRRSPSGGYRVDYSTSFNNLRLLGGSTVINFPLTLSYGSWYHLAVVSDGTGSVTAYKDGVAIGTPQTGYNSGAVVSGATALIGDCWAGGANGSAGGWCGFNGKLDEVQLFRSALSVADIQKIYNNNTSWVCSGSYIVTYNGNAATTGSVPLDGASHPAGSSATVLANSGSLTRTGYSFSGWNTASDGSGTNYQPGSTLTLGNAGITLYARWTPQPALTVTLAGSGSGTVAGTNGTGTDYSCTSLVCPTMYFTTGDSVTLTATPASNNSFTSWDIDSGAIISNITPYTGLLMNGNRSVTATFTTDPATVMISGSATPYYSIDAALDACSLDNTVRARNIDFTGVTMTGSHSIRLQGGYPNATFGDGTQSGYTTIIGSLTIAPHPTLGPGRLTVELLKISPPR